MRGCVRAERKKGCPTPKKASGSGRTLSILMSCRVLGTGAPRRRHTVSDCVRTGRNKGSGLSKPCGASAETY